MEDRNRMAPSPHLIKNIWISYSYADTEFVDKLSNALNSSGHTIFRVGRDMGAGELIFERILEAIEKADVILLIISHKNENSSWLTTETALILSEVTQKKNKKFIPILIDKGVSVSPLIQQFHFIDFANKSFSDNIQRILKALEEYEPSTNIEWNDTVLNISKEYIALQEQAKLQLRDRELKFRRMYTVIVLLTTLIPLLFSLLFLDFKKIDTPGLVEWLPFVMASVALVLSLSAFLRLRRGKKR
jgi:hypothetical protein